MQLTTFESWEQVGRWYASLEKDRRAPTPEVRAKAQDLTKGLNGDLAKTEGLYDYVAKNFRYVSLSLRRRPLSTSCCRRTYFHNRYGDCKDKHTLLAAVARMPMDYRRQFVSLINSSRKLDPDVPSPSQFDHVITMLPLGKSGNLDGYHQEVAPFRLLSSNLRKKQALVIPPNDVPHLEATPLRIHSGRRPYG